LRNSLLEHLGKADSLVVVESKTSIAMTKLQPTSIGLAAAGAFCIGAAAGYAIGRSKPADESDAIATVRDLFVYPVKGCAPIRVSSVKVTARGLEDDRLFMVVDFVGRMQTQRQLPAMATVCTSWDELGNLVLSAPGQANFCLPRKHFERGERRKVKVWDYECDDAIDQGNDVASFFSKALGASGLRLVRMPEAHVRPVRTGKQALVEAASHKTSFADKYPVLLTNQSSLEDVREKSGVQELSMLRFRPNIVTGGPTLKAWDENSWSTLHIGPNRFEVAELCKRCQVPRIDPATGIPRTDGEPTATLQELTNNCFGQNLCALDFGGVISVGDAVFVEVSNPDLPDAAKEKAE
jgi:uncharacterized protein